MSEAKQPKPTWGHITRTSVATLFVAFGFSLLWQSWAFDLLLALYLFGAVAGWFARRQGWLCGVIVGLPVALFQLTRLALHDHANFASLLRDHHYWILAVPAAVTATGVAIMGGMSGAFLQDMRLQRGK